MKCSKCGSDNITTERRINGYHICKKCGYQWQIGSNPEPTTAKQKLWWLIENNKICVSYGYIEMYRGERNPLEFCWAQGRPVFKGGKHFETFEQAINAAYDWAKEQK